MMNSMFKIKLSHNQHHGRENGTAREPERDRVNPSLWKSYNERVLSYINHSRRQQVSHGYNDKARSFEGDDDPLPLSFFKKRFLVESIRVLHRVFEYVQTRYRVDDKRVRPYDYFHEKNSTSCTADEKGK